MAFHIIHRYIYTHIHRKYVYIYIYTPCKTVNPFEGLLVLRGDRGLSFPAIDWELRLENQLHHVAHHSDHAGCHRQDPELVPKPASRELKASFKGAI